MKIKSLIIALIVVLTVSAIPTVSMAADDVYILFRSENFSFPAAQGGWSKPTDAANYANALPGAYMKDSAFDNPSTATFYIREEGEYVIWANMVDFTADFGKRHAIIGIDGENDSATFGSSIPDGWDWVKGDTVFYLTPGLHTLELKCGFPSMCCSAVMITNDMSFTLDENTPYSSIEGYADTEKPSFDNAVKVTRDDLTKVTVQFQNADDNIGVSGVKYTLDGTELENVVNNEIVIESLKPLHTYTVAMTAYDNLGNMSVSEQEITLARWKLAGYTSSIASNTATINYDVQHMETGTDNCTLFVAVYNKTSNKMLIPQEISVSASGRGTHSETAALTLPQEVMDNPGDYEIKAFLTDSADIMNAQSSAMVIQAQEVMSNE